MKNSLSNRIVNYLKTRPRWINGGEIEERAIMVGYKASNASRRCRELASEGIIDRKIDMGSVWYKYNL